MALIVAVEASYARLRAGLLNTDHLARFQAPSYLGFDTFVGEPWDPGDPLSNLGAVAKLGNLPGRIQAIIQRVANGHEQEIAGIGVTISAAVHRNGVVYLTHEDEEEQEGGIVEVDIFGSLQTALATQWNRNQEDIVVAVENRSNMGAWGEYRIGQGAVLRNIMQINPVNTIYVTISANLSVGIIADDHLYRGLKGYAGQMGHLVIDAASNRECKACKKKGCASELISGRALVHDVQAAADAHGSTSCITSKSTATTASDAAQYDPGYVGTLQDGRESHYIDARSILLATQGQECPVAEQAKSNLVGNLAKMVEEITYIFDPSLVVLGGIASLIPALSEEVVKRLNLRPFVSGGRQLLTAHLTDRSSLYGAALWVDDVVRQQSGNGGGGQAH